MESALTKKEPEKKLLVALKGRGGRSFSGRVTIRHRGGGVKRLYRLVDFGEEKLGISGKVIALEYDPYRTSYIALVEYGDGDKRYILAAKDLKVGDEILCAEKTDLKTSNRQKLKNVPVGTLVYNVELEPGRGGIMARGAGTSVKILALEEGFSHLEMPSGEVRKVSQESYASIGQVSHPGKKFERIRKAGLRRLKGWRPQVRGTAMNPPDHPHGGGGGGKAPIGLVHPKTPWGKPARGVKTRKSKRSDRLIIQRRK